MHPINRCVFLLITLAYLACDTSPGEPVTAPEPPLISEPTEPTEATEPTEPSGTGCESYAPVCGEDGLTYASVCDAQSVEVEIASFTPCDCGAKLLSATDVGALQGTWAATSAWPVRLEISGSAIIRTDYIGGCAQPTGCSGPGAEVSYGTLNPSGPLVHVNWTQPSMSPAISLPILYLFEPDCPDGDVYLVELAPVEIFFAKQP